MIRTEAAKERKRQRNRERYFWLKSIGYCTQCGHEQAVPGELFCIDCAEKNDGYRAKYNALHFDAERARADNRALYAKRKVENKCVRCGADLGGKNGTWCEACRLKKNEYQREAYRKRKKLITREEAVARGLCVKCRKKPMLAGKSTCCDCNVVLRRQVEFMQERKKQKKGEVEK